MTRVLRVTATGGMEIRILSDNEITKFTTPTDDSVGKQSWSVHMVELATMEMNWAKLTHIITTQLGTHVDM